MSFDDPRMLVAAMILFAAGLLVGAKVSREKKNETERKLMNALENLTAAIASLQTSVDGAVTEITKPHATDAQVQAGADAILAQNARLDAAVLTQNPTPPGEPLSLRR